MSEDATVRNISHIVLQVSDMQESIPFYQKLGFAVDRIISYDPNNPGDLNDLENLPVNRTEAGEFSCIGMGLGKDDPRQITRLELMEWKKPTKLDNYDDPEKHLGLVRVAFTVKGVEELAERLKEAGHRVNGVEKIDISPKLSSAFSHVYDPDGNWLTLMEWIKK